MIGRNVWKAHAVYWPALLLSARLPLPREILVHGFLTSDGRKSGKSLGNAVDPFDWVDLAGPDGVRYYLLAARSPFEDGDVTAERLLESYNADLAGGLGNLVSRLLALGERIGLVTGDESCPPAPEAGSPEAPPGYSEAFDEYRLDRALSALWGEIRELDRDIDRTATWRLPPGEARRHVTGWLDRVRRLALWLEPFLPRAAAEIERRLRPGPVRRGTPLFPRITPPSRLLKNVAERRSWVRGRSPQDAAFTGPGTPAPGSR